MRVTIAAIGRMKAGPERELAERYVDRFKKAGPALGLDYAGLVELPESRAGNVAERKREEAARLLAATPEPCIRIVLDESGKLISSGAFADTLASHRDDGQRDLAFFIGGPDGHDDVIRRRSDLTLSLGRMTFPHQLVRIVLLEQLYRAATILAGHPYHRA